MKRLSETGSPAFKLMVAAACLVPLILAACGEPSSTATTRGQGSTTGAAPETTVQESSSATAATPNPTTSSATINQPSTQPATTANETPTGNPPGTTTASPPSETRQAASPQPTSLPLAEDEQEVTFNSAGDTLFGTLLLPKQSTTGKVPATLLIAGSGPTDRNGNNPLIPGLVNSQLNFARVLADQGVASLRYDKIGTGKTGLGRFATNPAAVDFQTFVDEARSAYNFLKTRPEIDPQRIMVLGHSEGGLIGLVLADQLKDSAGVKALTLAAPLSRPYLQTIHDQLTTQYAAAVKAGSVTQEQADAALAELDQIIKSLQETGKIPATVTNPALKQIFSPYNEKFLAQVSKYDPQQIAAGLPTGFPALVMCGAKDQQVSCEDVKVMMQGFEKAGNSHASFFELPNVNHVFKEVSGTPNPGLDYGNPNLKFSQEAIMRLSAFVKANL